MAYKLKLKQDTDVAIVFLDAITTIPTAKKLPNSRELDPVQKEVRDNFVKTFNFNYAASAERISLNGMPLIIVKGFYFDYFLKESPEMELVVDSSQEEIEQAEQSLISGWVRIFDFTEEEVKQYLQEYKSRYKSQLN